MTLESKVKLVFGAQCSLDGTSVTFPSNESLQDFIKEYDRLNRDSDHLQRLEEQSPNQSNRIPRLPPGVKVWNPQDTDIHRF